MSTTQTVRFPCWQCGKSLKANISDGGKKCACLGGLIFVLVLASAGLYFQDTLNFYLNKALQSVQEQGGPQAVFNKAAAQIDKAVADLPKTVSKLPELAPERLRGTGLAQVISLQNWIILGGFFVLALLGLAMLGK